MVGAPIIVSVLLDGETFHWLDGLRRTHFPPDRNVLPAHLTMFHHLPPSIVAELDQRLIEATRRRRPQATASGVMNLGRGTAIRIDAPDLVALRAELAECFRDMLIPQDTAGWRPHVTIQNKVRPAEAKMLFEELTGHFRPRPVTVAGLATWRYQGGPWEPVKSYMFR